MLPSKARAKLCKGACRVVDARHRKRVPLLYHSTLNMEEHNGCPKKTKHMMSSPNSRLDTNERNYLMSSHGL